MIELRLSFNIQDEDFKRQQKLVYKVQFFAYQLALA